MPEQLLIVVILVVDAYNVNDEANEIDALSIVNAVQHDNKGYSKSL